MFSMTAVMPHHDNKFSFTSLLLQHWSASFVMTDESMAVLGTTLKKPCSDPNVIENGHHIMSNAQRNDSSSGRPNSHLCSMN